MSDSLPTATRVSDPGIRALYRLENRWQAWLDVEVALAMAQAELEIVRDVASAFYATALAGGFLLAFDNPARRSFVPELVPDEDVQNAATLNSAVMTSARIFGPALGGVLVITAGYGWAFTLDAFSYRLQRPIERRRIAPSRTPAELILAIVENGEIREPDCESRIHRGQPLQTGACAPMRRGIERSERLTGVEHAAIARIAVAR